VKSGAKYAATSKDQVPQTAERPQHPGVATRGNKVSFGEYGLKAVTRGRLTSRQIEAAHSI